MDGKSVHSALSLKLPCASCNAPNIPLPSRRRRKDRSGNRSAALVKEGEARRCILIAVVVDHSHKNMKKRAENAALLARSAAMSQREESAIHRFTLSYT